MLIIARTALFIEWIVVALIIAVIGLMIVRLIANAMDLNPFTWLASTIRRLSDPFITPMRRGLMGFGIDPKYAPLVVILITILLGFFVLQITSTLAYTAAGILVSIQSASMIRILGYIIYGAVTIYMLLIFIRIVFSWGMVSYTNRLMKFLVDTTEPLLGPLRRIIPPLGMMDISPIFAFLILWLLQSAIQGTLLRGAGPVNF
jgi:YggT family protein